VIESDAFNSVTLAPYSEFNGVSSQISSNSLGMYYYNYLYDLYIVNIFDKQIIFELYASGYIAFGAALKI
jgi:hypothetical protein